MSTSQYSIEFKPKHTVAVIDGEIKCHAAGMGHNSPAKPSQWHQVYINMWHHQGTAATYKTQKQLQGFLVHVPDCPDQEI